MADSQNIYSHNFKWVNFKKQFIFISYSIILTLYPISKQDLNVNHFWTVVPVGVIT